MSKFLFEHGHEAEDVVTGFRGIITQRCDFLTGCNQYCLISQSKDGKEPTTKWVDEPRLKLVEGGRKVNLATEGTKSPKPGGIAESYPSRNS